MSKKHYIEVAKLIQQLPDEPIKITMAERLAALFAADNPRFDRDRFLTACGL